MAKIWILRALPDAPHRHSIRRHGLRCTGGRRRRGSHDKGKTMRRFTSQTVCIFLLAILWSGGTGCTVSLCDQDGDGLCPPVEDCDDSQPGAFCETATPVQATETPSDFVTPTATAPVEETSPPCDWYPDGDGDGFGDASADSSCQGIDGLVQDHSDCDDGNSAIHPGALELCDGVDNNCNDQIDEDTTRRALHVIDSAREEDPMAWTSISFNSLTLNTALFATLGALVGTPLMETQGCDSTCINWYADADGDGYGDMDAPLEVCDGSIPDGHVDNAADCDDTRSTTYPGAFDVIGDGLDGNCDDVVDIISTAAGTGAAGFSGDGGPAPSATLSFPAGLATDAQGAFYIADSSNHRIRRVGTDGVISTVAGTGTAGFSGDGNAATSAQLSSPQGVWVDSAGTLYIADTYNQRIRKVNSAGIISTIAGNGGQGFAGDGGAATSASFNLPMSVTDDGKGNLYVADLMNQRIRKIDSSNIIRTVAGTGTAYFSGDGGAATAATLNKPYAVATDLQGNLLIADSGNGRIRQVNANGVINTIAGNGQQGYSGDEGPATAAALFYPIGITRDIVGNLFISDRYNFRVRRVAPDGIISTVAGTGTQGTSGDGGSATSARLDALGAVAISPQGRLYIAEPSINRVRVVNP